MVCQVLQFNEFICDQFILSHDRRIENANIFLLMALDRPRIGEYDFRLNRSDIADNSRCSDDELRERNRKIFAFDYLQRYNVFVFQFISQIAGLPSNSGKDCPVVVD
jgi:hypothetical protein